MAELLTIGEVARRAGVATSALRFYEERGLIHSERAGSGHRRYQRAVIRRVAFIVFAQRIGLSLEEVSYEVNVGDGAGRQLGDEVAALGVVGDDPLGGERLQCLADGDQADPELLRGRLLEDLHSRRELASEDGVTEFGGGDRF